jgi:hypothetical protein
MQSSKTLLVAGAMSLIAAILHVMIIVGGPEWYRFFGAGEQMAQLAAQGSVYPAVVTSIIAFALTVCSLYAYSGARLIHRLPFLRAALIAITLVFCVRGLVGMIIPFASSDPYIQRLGMVFWLWSSLICLAMGVAYLLGTKQAWQYLSESKVDGAS